jgi:hypothetical protein
VHKVRVDRRFVRTIFPQMGYVTPPERGVICLVRAAWARNAGAAPPGERPFLPVVEVAVGLG